MNTHCEKTRENSSPEKHVGHFNHISREVISASMAKRFYLDHLGFEEIPRPSHIGCEGAWLLQPAAGVHVHLIETPHDDDGARKRLEEMTAERKAHQRGRLPFVDHIAFLCDDVDAAESMLKAHGVFVFRHAAAFGAQQLFFEDPDGHVIELSSCAPEPGATACNTDGKVGK